MLIEPTLSSRHSAPGASRERRSAAPQAEAEAEIRSTELLQTPLVRVRQVCCAGPCGHVSATEVSAGTHLVYTYRGLFTRHIGQSEEVSDANQVAFFNHDQEYRISHPVAGGDDCVSITFDPAVLQEAANARLARGKSAPTFLQQRLRLTPAAQLQLARLRLALAHEPADALRTESLAVDVLAQTLDPPQAQAPSTTPARKKLADRIKRRLGGEPLRRWTLSDIAREVGGSPLHLTQVFRQVEGLPLYKYQRQLRLAHALTLLPHSGDLTGLALDLGFSSHSHFSSAFRQAFGVSPGELRPAAKRRRAR